MPAKYHRPSTSKSIYGHRFAGRRAYKLFEELSELYSCNGEVHMSRTMRSSKGDDIDYSPVYKIWYEPNFWQHISRDVVNELFEIGDKYQCRVLFVVKGNRAVALFDDAGQNFKRN